MQGLQELPAEEEEALQRRGSESALVTLSWYTGHHVFSLVSGSHSREQLPSTRAARRNGGFLSQAQIPQERDFLTQFSISSHSWPSQLWPETNRRGLGAAGTAWRRRELPTTEDKQDDTLLAALVPSNVPTLSGLSRVIHTYRLKEQMIETSRSFN